MRTIYLELGSDWLDFACTEYGTTEQHDMHMAHYMDWLYAWALHPTIH